MMFALLGQSVTDEGPAPHGRPGLSVVGEGTTATGSFDLTEDDLRVDGRIDGDVRTSGRVHVAHGGVIHGDVRAGSIRVAGRVEGVLCASEELVLLASAAVDAVLCAGALTIEEGADFEGALCDSEDRISALRAVLSASQADGASHFSSGSDVGDGRSTRSSETVDAPVTLDVEQPSAPEDGDVDRPTHGGDFIPAAGASNSSGEDANADEEREEGDGAAEPLSSELEW